MKTVLPDDVCERYFPAIDIKDSNIVHVHYIPTRNGQGITLLAETEPRHVRFHHRANKSSINKTETSYTLAFPRLLWSINLHYQVSDGGLFLNDQCGLYVHLNVLKEPFSKHKLSSNLFCLPVSNQFDLGQTAMCVGDGIYFDRKKDFRQQSNEFLTRIFHSKWNEDLGVEFYNTGIVSYSDWEAGTLKNPDFHSIITYRPKSYRDVNGMLKHIECTRYTQHEERIINFLAEGI